MRARKDQNGLSINLAKAHNDQQGLKLSKKQLWTLIQFLAIIF